MLGETFRKHVAIGPGCWEWTGCRRKDGYGEMRRARSGPGSILRAHRVAWELAHGAVPEGLDVLHHCDNPPCVKTEPDERWPEGHLWLGTDLDNHRDRVAKGRSARGEQHGAARLTEDDVRRIRARRSVGATQLSLAVDFGVSRGTVGHILAGTYWGWLRS